MIPALEIEKLTVYYGQRLALSDLSFSISQGKLVALIGPNGAGKSTFLKAVVGLLDRVSGRIACFGEPFHRVSLQVAYVPQRSVVDWDFPITVEELVAMGRYGRLGLFRSLRAEDLQIIQESLDAVGMLEYRTRQISQLSGGQQQRVFIARAFAQQADLYLMDEPFSAVDLGTESLLVQLLQELRRRGKTVVVVHHDLASVKNYFDEAVLVNIRLIAEGEVRTVLTPRYLHAAYGKNSILFEETLRT